MGDVTVGGPESPCSIGAITNELNESLELSKLQDDWTKLARKLGIPQDKIKAWNQDLLSGKLQPLDVFVSILTEWVCRIGSNRASLSELVRAFRQCGWNNFSDGLVQKYMPQNANAGTLDYALDWDFLFLGVGESLHDLLSEFTDEEKQDFLENELRDEVTMQDSHITNYMLAADDSPEMPLYHIPRKILRRAEISQEMFKIEHSDVFVIAGISLFELTKHADKYYVSTSSAQTIKIQSQFIQLDIDNFNELVGLPKHSYMAIHLLQHNNGKFYWVETHGTMDFIQQLVQTEENPIGTEEFVKVISDCHNNALPICITGSLGIGKTYFLADIYQNIRQKYPNRICMFLKVPKLIETFREKYLKAEHIIELITQSVTKTMFGLKVTKKLFKSEKQRFEIFLDEFDKLSPHQIPLGIELINILSQEFKQFRVFVSIRENQLKEIEKTLMTLAFKIDLLNQQDQVELLISYWENNCKITATPNLRVFANSILLCISKTFCDDKENIASFPIYCVRLAEIYKEDARIHAINSEMNPEVTVAKPRLYEIYNQMTKLIFRDACKNQQSILWNLHIVAAAEVIAPQYTKEARKLLCLNTISSSCTKDVQSLGIMEINRDEGLPISFKFIHRSYAEFFYADFVVDMLKDRDNAIQHKLGEKLFFHAVKTIKSDNGICLDHPDCERASVINDVIQSCTNSVYDWRKIAEYLNFGTAIDSIRDAVNHENDTSPVSYLYHTISKWVDTQEMPKLKELLTVLVQCNLEDAAEKLMDKYYASRFNHLGVCFFVDAKLLVEHKSRLILACKNKFCGMQTENTQIVVFNILRTCLYNDLSSIFCVVSDWLLNKKDSVVLCSAISNINWVDLLKIAIKYSSLHLFKECIKFLQNIVKLKNWKLSEIIYTKIECTPLHAAIRIGDINKYNYIRTLFKMDTRELPCLVHVCVENSLFDPSHIIKQKLDILETLLDTTTEQAARLGEETPDLKKTPILMHNIHIRLLEFLLNKSADFNGKTLQNKTFFQVVEEYLPPNDLKELVCKLERQVNDIFKNSIGTGNEFCLDMMHKADELGLRRIWMLHPQNPIVFDENTQKKEFQKAKSVRQKIFFELLRLIEKNTTHVFPHKQTALHVAAANGNAEAVAILLLGDASVDAVDISGQTSLHCALQKANKNVNNVVRLLLDYNADITKADRNGIRPMWYAYDKELSAKLKTETIEILTCHLEKLHWTKRGRIYTYDKAQKIFGNKYVLSIIVGSLPIILIVIAKHKRLQIIPRR